MNASELQFLVNKCYQIDKALGGSADKSIINLMKPKNLKSQESLMQLKNF